jgi:hypothetical protein
VFRNLPAQWCLASLCNGLCAPCSDKATVRPQSQNEQTNISASQAKSTSTTFHVQPQNLSLHQIVTCSSFLSRSRLPASLPTWF